MTVLQWKIEVKDYRSGMWCDKKALFPEMFPEPVTALFKAKGQKMERRCR
jgi:hypothetical protein